MKKQIALLATIMVTSGLAAFGQGFVNLNVANLWIYDQFTTPGVGVKDNANLDVVYLWAPTATADLLTSQGTGPNQSTINGAAVDQVATNGIVSMASPLATITSMVTSGGWNFVTNDYPATAGFGTLALSTTSTKGGAAYAGGSSGTIVQVLGTTAGSTIQLIALAWNASASSLAAASDIGWSNPFSYATGANSTDNAGTVNLSSEGMNQFGVAVIAVPEPTTLALAGLGGLSMLFLRRRNS